VFDKLTDEEKLYVLKVVIEIKMPREEVVPIEGTFHIYAKDKTAAKDKFNAAISGYEITSVKSKKTDDTSD